MRGLCCGEKKCVFGRSKAAFDKAVAKHQEETLERFNGRGDAFQGQLLLVTQVSGSSKPERLATKLFYTTGAGRLELQPRNAEALTFDKVWGKCAAYTTGNGLDVVTVSEFLAFAGETNKHVLERVGVWTKGGFGVRKTNFFKVRVVAGTGARKRWCATKKTLYKIWPVLRTRFTRKRRA